LTVRVAPRNCRLTHSADPPAGLLGGRFHVRARRVNEVVKLLIIVLSAAISALLVHDLLEFGQAHAQVMLPPLARTSFTI